MINSVVGTCLPNSCLFYIPLKAEDMIKNIKNEFNLILDEIEWMDAETRQDAKTKV